MYTFIFRFMLENKLALDEKQLQRARKDNQLLTRYIHGRRKKEVQNKEEEAQKKAENEARRKETIKDMVVARWSDEGQSSKDVRTWRK
jgi:hypothetical protein